MERLEGLDSESEQDSEIQQNYSLIFAYRLSHELDSTIIGGPRQRCAE